MVFYTLDGFFQGKGKAVCSTDLESDNPFHFQEAEQYVVKMTGS